MKDINKLTSDLLNKEAELSSLSKKAVQSISEFETETDTLIKFLHTTRDEQVRYICSFFSQNNIPKVLEIVYIQLLLNYLKSIDQSINQSM